MGTTILPLPWHLSHLFIPHSAPGTWPEPPQRGHGICFPRTGPRGLGGRGGRGGGSLGGIFLIGSLSTAFAASWGSPACNAGMHIASATSIIETNLIACVVFQRNEPVRACFKQARTGDWQRDGSLWINHNDTGTAALVASVCTPEGSGHLAFAATAWAGHLNRLAGLLSIALIRIGITISAAAPPRTTSTSTVGHLLLITTTLRRTRHRWPGFNHLDVLSGTGYHLSGTANNTINRTGVRHWRKRQSNSCYYCVYFHSILG